MKGIEYIIFIIPATLLGVTFLVAIFTKGGGVILRLGKGVLTAGMVTGAVEFVLLVPLLFKGTDGPGGLIAIILPIVTVMGATFMGTVLMSIGGLSSAVKGQEKLKRELSAEAEAILNRHKDFIRPAPVVAGPTWRDFAKAAPVHKP